MNNNTVGQAAAAVGNAIPNTIEAFAVAERRRNFHFLARGSHVYMDGEDLDVERAVTDDIAHGIQRWHVDPSQLTACTWYNFIQPLYNLKDMVPIRWPRSLAINRVTVDLMEALDVEDTKTWMPLCAWMRKKFEWHDQRDWTQRGGRQLQLDEQKIWWDNNGKHFPLMALPREMRDSVYLEIIGPIILPEVRAQVPNSESVTLGHGLVHGPKGRAGYKLDPDIDRPCLEILLVNRQVGREAKAAVWQQATKRFHATHQLPAIATLQHIKLYAPKLYAPTPKPAMALQRVQLELSAACYFQLLSIRPSPGAPFGAQVPNHANTPLHALKALETVKYLDLRFISPKHANAVCPWGGRPGGPTRGHSCQKKWIDWFFTFALEYFINCDIKVTMSGCVKDSTRAKWEPILKQAPLLRVPDPYATVKQGIRQGKQDDLPIACHCIPPCWVADDAPNNGTQDLVNWNNRHILNMSSFMIERLGARVQKNYFSFGD